MLKKRLLAVLADVETAEKYIELLIEKYPRYARDQLRIMHQCAAQYSASEIKNALVLNRINSSNYFFLILRGFMPKITLFY